MEDKLLTIDEVAAILHVTRATLARWRFERKYGPPWLKPSPRVVLYSTSGFSAWVKTTEEGMIAA